MSRIKSKSHTGVYRENLLDGDVSYYYTYKDSQGKKRWVKVGKKSEGYSERDAVVQRREAIAKTVMNNTPVYVQKNRKRSVTVRELAKKYFSEKTEMKNHRDAYLKYYNIIDPEFGHRDIYTVQISEIRNFKESLRLKYRPASVNYYLALFKAIVNYAISNEMIFCINPCSSVPLLPLNNNRQRVLSEDEIETLLEALRPKPKAYLFVLIAILTGARPQAVINLRKKDIDVNLSSMLLMAMKKRPPYSVGVHARLKASLSDWIRILQPEEYLFYRQNPKIDKSVHISYISIKNMVHPVMDRLFNDGLSPNDRINRVTLYTLRHSFGTLLSKNGANAFVIKDLMNHAKIETTDRYIKVNQDISMQYVNAIFGDTYEA